jgi:pantoate--beta-alanine ligase
VIVSVFVNPLQFGAGEDLDAYPRTFDADRDRLAAAGVDILFHPTVEEMYPPGAGTRVVPAAVAEPLEGEKRPGHFTGVATVVARLLGAAIPDSAYFGEKDAQQLAVVRAMVRDLAIPVEIVACPTVRDQDGLALSSRNQNLDPGQRQAALSLVRALAEGQAAFAGGTTAPAEMASLMLDHLRRVDAVDVDYAAVADPDTFAVPHEVEAGSKLLVAARVGATRLIDNATAGGGDLLAYRAPGPAEVAAWNA